MPALHRIESCSENEKSVKDAATAAVSVNQDPAAMPASIQSTTTPPVNAVALEDVLEFSQQLEQLRIEQVANANETQLAMAVIHRLFKHEKEASAFGGDVSYSYDLPISIVSTRKFGVLNPRGQYVQRTVGTEGSAIHDIFVGMNRRQKFGLTKEAERLRELTGFNKQHMKDALEEMRKTSLFGKPG